MTALLIAVPFLFSFPAFFAEKKSTRLSYFFALFGTLLTFLLSLAHAFFPGGPLVLPLMSRGGLRFESDGFRRIYVLLLSFMWFAVMLLSRDYFRGHHRTGRYYLFNLMTLSATIGVFLSADFFTTLVFFEIMSFTSFPWVIQEETEEAVKAACTYLAVAVIGGLAALMGLFLLSHHLGTLVFSELPAAAAACKDRAVLYVAGGCILFGFGAKAGMFPLHIWLPKAHPAAPAPASALLSGVLTKSGVFGVILLTSRIFAGDTAWGAVLLFLGVITMLLGAILALFSVNLKRTLACSSMSQIGFILTGLGMSALLGEENAIAVRGAFLHMLNHSVFKLILFMSAGIVYMNAHTLDLNKLRGFGRKKPLLLLAFLSGAAGISGIPLLSGYVSKTLLHESIVHGAHLAEGTRFLSMSAPLLLHIAEWCFLIAGGMTLAYMTKLFVCLFVQKPAEEAAAPQAAAKTAKEEHRPAGANAQAHEAAHGFGRPFSYMGLPTGLVLAFSALLPPVFGATASFSMDRLADLGTDFFLPGAWEEAVRYFSFENLKGGLISIGIGVLLYLLFVRLFLMDKERYLDRWPKKLDLEDAVYRPLLLRLLPGILTPPARLFAENRVTGFLAKKLLALAGFVSGLFAENRVTGFLAKAAVRLSGILSRAFSDMVDAFVLLLRRSVFRENRQPASAKELTSASYRAGAVLDRLFSRSPERKKKAKKKNGTKEDRLARLSYRTVHTFIKTTHEMSDSMSFALLALVLALSAVLIYILAVHR